MDKQTFTDLTKPRVGWYFAIWKLLIHLNWAKTWTWCNLNEKKDVKRTHYIALSKIEKLGAYGKSTAISLTIGPLKIMVG